MQLQKKQVSKALMALAILSKRVSLISASLLQEATGDQQWELGRGGLDLLDDEEVDCLHMGPIFVRGKGKVRNNIFKK